MPDLTDDQWSQVEAHLYDGRKIEAIKVYREATGAGLKESKDILDQHEAELRGQFPERFKTTGKAGCGTAVMLLAVGLLGLGAAALAATYHGV